MVQQQRRSFVSILVTLALLYVGWAALLFVTQRGMMFPGAGMALPRASGNGVPLGVEQIWLPFAGGVSEAWFVPSPDPAPSPAVLFAHGNAELIDYAMADAHGLRDLGLSVLLVEYPGYGRSEGTPSRTSIAETFQAAYDWVASRDDVDPTRIVGFGRSLGSGAVTDLATQRKLRSLVLVSPFTSVGDFAKRYLLPPFLARDRFDNRRVLRDFAGPVLLIHGTRDRIIPHSHSERLLRASATAELVSLDCGHNDCPPDWEAYLEHVRAFLAGAGVIPEEQSGAVEGPGTR